ncbi:group-specific protein [Fluoribacter gormanii]|uniref:group-specific protein n=1 Tax=Fluoribacter gormanii TaxID=464 RepID=UPI001F5ED0E5|nr:group-specific protein [Fluoribacter gormanii]
MFRAVLSKEGLYFGILFCLILSCMTSIANAGNTLLPPWYLLQSRLSAALSADPCVHVANLMGEGRYMEIKITVCNEDKAQALASFVNRIHEFGERLVVTVKVYASDSIPVEASASSSVKESVELLTRALKGNKYFIKAGTAIRGHVESAYAVFKPQIIQYYSDDVGDWFLNSNEVAAKLFSDIFNLNPFAEDAVKIYASTAIIEK